MTISKFLITILVLPFYQFAASQADSTNLGASNEKAYAEKYNLKVRYLDRYMNNEKRLLKLNVPLFGMGLKKIGYNKEPEHYYKYFSLELMLTYERKLSNMFSVYISNNSALNQASISGFEMVNEPTGFNDFYNAFDIGTRYYFFMNHRIKQGLSGNNLYGNYLGLAVEGLSKVHFLPKAKYELFEPEGYRIYLGSQNRINEWAYYDVSFYLRFDPRVPSDYSDTKYIQTAGILLKIGLVRSFE